MRNRRSKYIIKKTKKGFSLYHIEKWDDVLCLGSEVGKIKEDALSLPPFKKMIKEGRYGSEDISMEEWVYGCPKWKRKTKFDSYDWYNIPVSPKEVYNCVFSESEKNIYPHIEIKNGESLSMLKGSDYYVVPGFERCYDRAGFLQLFGITSLYYEKGISFLQIMTFLSDAFDAFTQICNVLRIRPKDISLNGFFTTIHFVRKTSRREALGGYAIGASVITIVEQRGNYASYIDPLIHEWAHLLDYFLGKSLLKPKRNSFKIHISDRAEEAPEYLRPFIKEIISGGNKPSREFRKKLASRDEKDEKEYYSTPPEIFAFAATEFFNCKGKFRYWRPLYLKESELEYHSNYSFTRFFISLRERSELLSKKRGAIDYFISADNDSLLFLAKLISDAFQHDGTYRENRYISFRFKDKKDILTRIRFPAHDDSYIWTAFIETILFLSLFDIEISEIVGTDSVDVDNNSWPRYWEKEHANIHRFCIWQEQKGKLSAHFKSLLEKKFGENSELKKILEPVKQRKRIMEKTA